MPCSFVPYATVSWPCTGMSCMDVLRRLDIYMKVALKVALDIVLSLQIFERFATSEWDLRILSGFLAADQLLGEPTRVACCDYPATHAPV